MSEATEVLQARDKQICLDARADYSRFVACKTMNKDRTADVEAELAAKKSELKAAKERADEAKKEPERKRPRAEAKVESLPDAEEAADAELKDAKVESLPDAEEAADAELKDAKVKSLLHGAEWIKTEIVQAEARGACAAKARDELREQVEDTKRRMEAILAEPADKAATALVEPLLAAINEKAKEWEEAVRQEALLEAEVAALRAQLTGTEELVMSVIKGVDEDKAVPALKAGDKRRRC